MPAARSYPGVRFLILEMAFIVFAVVLGFFVTNWDEARRDRDRADFAVDRIRMELERNAAGVASAAPYYSEMAQRPDSILTIDGDGVVRELAIPGWRGLSPPPIRTASFKVATATGALEHVDFALADEIALTYEVLEDLSTSIDHTFSTFMTGVLTRVSEWQVVFALLAELAIIAEDQSARIQQALSDPDAGRQDVGTR